MKNQEIHLPTPNPEHPYGGGNGRYRFPDINGMNLLGDNISLPPIVPKSFHIMLTVFHPETLYGMKKWLPFCEDLRKQFCWFCSHPQLKVMSPPLHRLWGIFRIFT